MLTFALAAMLAQASVLDRPIDTKPTVRSEIARGQSAAASCIGAHEGYLTCIAAAESANRQKMSAGFEPFNAGMHCQMAKILADLKEEEGLLISYRKECARAVEEDLHLPPSDKVTKHLLEF